VSKEEFKKLFLEQLEIAVHSAEERFKLDLPRNFKIRLAPRGTTQGDQLFDFDTVLNMIYTEEQLFPLYVDLAIEAVTISRKFAIAYVGISKTERVKFELTWNYNTDAGPFKQRINEEFSIISG
jgi:hypothetical protein